MKILVIVGPTASGKSALAVELAKKYSGEVISADSRQVYRGMDIGTGKNTAREARGVPHHLIDVADPKEDYNVSHFVTDAKRILCDIECRTHLPIVVGGTGMWIDALLYDWKLPEVKPIRALRARMEKQATEKLFAELARRDPRRASTIDRRNRRRLIRALEIILATGKAVPPYRVASFYDRVDMERRYNALIIGINVPKDELNKKIKQRLLSRLEQGMIHEVKNLHNHGVSWKKLDNFGLEYRYISRYLRSVIGYREMVNQLYSEIKKYAKRQITWFKRNKEINWIPAPVLEPSVQYGASLRSLLLDFLS